MEPTIVTWVLVAFGVITMGTPAYIYLVFLRSPHSQKSKDLMLGAGKDWRDGTHLDLNVASPGSTCCSSSRSSSREV